MKVWIVNYGQYEDWGIEKVFDSARKAARYVREKDGKPVTAPVTGGGTYTYVQHLTNLGAFEVE